MKEGTRCHIRTPGDNSETHLCHRITRFPIETEMCTTITDYAHRDLTRPLSDGYGRFLIRRWISHLRLFPFLIVLESNRRPSSGLEVHSRAGPYVLAQPIYHQPYLLPSLQLLHLECIQLMHRTPSSPYLITEKGNFLKAVAVSSASLPMSRVYHYAEIHYFGLSGLCNLQAPSDHCTEVGPFFL